MSSSEVSILSSSLYNLWSVEVVDVIGVVLYMILFCLICANYLWRLRSNAILCKSLATVFYLCLPFFLLVRILWLVISMRAGTGGVSLFMNRIAFCIFLFVFNSVLFYWIDTVHTTINVLFAKQAFHGDLDYSYLSTPVKLLFWIMTFAMALFTLGTAFGGYIYYHGRSPDDSPIYNANILCISACSLIYSGGFLFYGTRLFIRLRDNSTLEWKELVKVECFSVTLCACFLVRVILFSIRIITGKLISHAAFSICAYWIPEMIPVLLCIWAVNSTIIDQDEYSSHSALIPKQQNQSKPIDNVSPIQEQSPRIEENSQYQAP